jgi:hypothetical protein
MHKLHVQGIIIGAEYQSRYRSDEIAKVKEVTGALVIYDLFRYNHFIGTEKRITTDFKIAFPKEI